MNKTIKIVAVLLFFVLLVGCVLYVKHFTANFTQDFATFYVSEGKQDVFGSSIGNVFNRLYVFDVHYTFGFLNNKEWSYKLQCTQDFVFTVNGVVHRFSELDLNKLFNVEQTDASLMVDFSKDVYTLLANYYGVFKQAIGIVPAVVNANIVTLIFYSANAKNSVTISGLFGGLDKIMTVTSNLTEVVF